MHDEKMFAKLENENEIVHTDIISSKSCTLCSTNLN